MADGMYLWAPQRIDALQNSVNFLGTANHNVAHFQADEVFEFTMERLADYFKLHFCIRDNAISNALLLRTCYGYKEGLVVIDFDERTFVIPKVGICEQLKRPLISKANDIATLL